MIAPVGAPSMPEAVRADAEVYAALRRELASRKLSTALGDEGGFAPEVREPGEVLSLLVQAITGAGYKTGAGGVSIALDPASSEFRQPDGRYRVAGELLTSAEMIDRYAAITEPRGELVAFSPDGKMLAGVGSDGSYLWDVCWRTAPVPALVPGSHRVLEAREPRSR